MNKGELIAAVAQRSGAPRVTVEAILNGVLDTIGTRLAVGERVSIPGFGTFEPRHRAARNGMNPATGARIQIAATTVPAFRAGQTLRGQVAGAPVPREASDAAAESEPVPAVAELEPQPQATPKAAKKKEKAKAVAKASDKASDKDKKRKKK